MLVHADISALFCGLAAKRVGIQFAADGNIEAPCFDSSLERLDGFMGTEDSTKTALILCSAMKAASVLMSEVPASLAVLIPGCL